MKKKNDKSVESSNKKVLYVALIMLVVLIIIVLLLVNNSSNKNKKPSNDDDTIINDEKGVIEDKEYDGLKFTSTSLVYDNEVSTLVTTVTNPTDSDYYLDEFHIFVKDEDNNDIINYEDENGNIINYLVGYVGDSIPAGDSVDITTSIDFDISSYAHNISYEAIK